MAIRVTVWNEYLHEVQFEEIAAVYPQGIHGCIQAFLEKEGFAVKTAALRQPEHGLTREVLESTDVLIWWGHMAHHEVEDEIVERVYRRVLDGMGLIVLHSGHASKIFQKLCGTDSSRLKWREDGEKEILWVVNPGHPIAAGLGEKIILEQEEMEITEMTLSAGEVHRKAREYGVSISSIVLAYIYSNPDISAHVLIGPVNIAQLEDSLSSCEMLLTGKEIRSLSVKQ